MYLQSKTLISKVDEIESKKEQERELQKIGLSIERLDSVRLALQKMGYRGLSVSRGGSVSDYTEIVYGVTGNKEFDYRIYDKPLTDSLAYELNRHYSLVVYNRYVVFSCVESSDYDYPSLVNMTICRNMQGLSVCNSL